VSQAPIPEPNITRSGTFLVLIGPDGVGKTSVAREMLEQHSGPTAYFHFRAPLSGRMDSEPPAETAPAIDKHPVRGLRLAGWARLARHLLLAWLGHFLAVRPALRRGTLVVGDRWSYGYLVQPDALRFYGPRWLAAIALQLLPRPDRVVNLTASVDEILSRKKELSEEEARHELAAWADLPVPGLVTMSTEGKHPSEVARQLLETLPPAGRYKRFPPGSSHILVPTSSRLATLAGLSLYAPCRPRGIWMQRTARLGVGICGPWILPGRSTRFEPPDHRVWAEMLRHWRELLGPFDDLAIVARRQSNRRGFSLLLIREAQPVGFVRVRPGLDPTSDGEATALRLLRESPPLSFHVPEILGAGCVADWGYVISSPLTGAPHRPLRNLQLVAILEELQRALEALPRPLGTPDSWVPMHGDLTPWNLRLTSDGRLMLLDWERAGWGPEGADELLYQAAEVALGWRSNVTGGHPDAARFWLTLPPGGIEDESLTKVLNDVARKRPSGQISNAPESRLPI
jgi:thymidylate kinase